MKQILVAAICFLAGSTIAQVAEAAPYQNNSSIPSNKALWSIQFSANVSAESSGTVGQAAVLYINNEIWTSMWASDTIIRYTSTGTFIAKFVVPGITGCRSMTTNGANVYIGTSSNTIYEVSPVLYALSGTITSAAPVTSRFLTFDATLDGGAGGFWTGNFNTDIVAIDMSGAVLSTIPAATHTLTGMYGAAVDNVNAGGPYLWVFHQAGANNSQMTVLNLTTGLPTTNTHDVFTDISATYSLASGLAGGAFFTTDYTTGPTIFGLVQGDPANIVVGYDAQLTSNVGVDENELSSALVYPIPASEVVTVEFAGEIAEAGTVSLVDVNGRIVLTQNFEKGVSALSVALKGVQAGTYLLNVTTPSTNMIRTVVVQ